MDESTQFDGLPSACPYCGGELILRHTEGVPNIGWCTFGHAIGPYYPRSRVRWKVPVELLRVWWLGYAPAR